MFTERGEGLCIHGFCVCLRRERLYVLVYGVLGLPASCLQGSVFKGVLEECQAVEQAERERRPAFVFPFSPAFPDSERWPPLLFSTIIFTFPHKKTRLIAAFGRRDVPLWLRPSAVRQSQQGRGSWTQRWDSVPTLASLLPPEGSY